MSDTYIHPSAIVDDGAEIGEGTRIWCYTHIQSGARVGRDCNLGQNVYVGDHAVIGDGCKLQNNVSVYEGVELEDYVFCGPSCVFTNDLTPRARYPKGSAGHLGTLVRRGATIGANATVVCNHTLGSWSMIAAGAVVACDVPDYALMAGVPARRVGWVCECGNRLAEPDTDSPNVRSGGGARYMCSRCAREYLQTGETLEEIIR